MLLLAGGMDLNTHDVLAHTPLRWVFENNHLDVIKLLLEEGADPKFLDTSQPLPIKMAEREQAIALR